MNGQVWLIGNKGMLGTELSLLLERRHIPFTGTDREVDITCPAALAAFAEALAGKGGLSWIVNCAAYTAVDRAEEEEALCRRLNTEGPGNIAGTARALGVPLIHLSTDYVFNGQAKRPYREDDPTDPTGVYGLSKRDGEIEVLKRQSDSYIIRTAWLYGAHGNNFVHTMLRLMNEREEVAVVDDQRGSPTWAADLSRSILAFIDRAEAGRPAAFGIYHFSGEGDITWYDFARRIYERGRALGLIQRECRVRPCGSGDYPAKVKRPSYSALDKSKIRAALDLDIPRWEESLDKFLEASHNK